MVGGIVETLQQSVYEALERFVDDARAWTWTLGCYSLGSVGCGGSLRDASGHRLMRCWPITSGKLQKWIVGWPVIKPKAKTVEYEGYKIQSGQCAVGERQDILAGLLSDQGD